MDNLSDERKQRIWDEIIKIHEGIRPDEKTKKMLMDEYNLTINQVETLVSKLIKQGIVTKRTVTINGRNHVVYRIVE